MTRAAASLVLLALLASGCSASTTPTATVEAEAEASTPSETATETDVPAEPLPPGAQGDWWTWSESAPRGQNPVLDRTGEHCAVGQLDDLWFLAGTYGGTAQRECAVPAGRTLVVPAVNLVCHRRDDTGGALTRPARRCCAHV